MWDKYAIAFAQFIEAPIDDAAIMKEVRAIEQERHVVAPLAIEALSDVIRSCNAMRNLQDSDANTIDKVTKEINSSVQKLEE